MRHLVQLIAATDDGNQKEAPIHLTQYLIGSRKQLHEKLCGVYKLFSLFLISAQNVRITCYRIRS